MYKNKVLFANAITLTTVFLWILCSLFVVVFPKLSYQITLWWFHGLFASPMSDITVTFEGIAMGGIYLALFAWIGAYSLGVFTALLRR